MSALRKEIAHILGLKDNPFDTAFENEGWQYKLASGSIKSRYEKLTNGHKVAFDPIKNQSSKEFAKGIRSLKKGDYRGFATRWEGHAFTLHAIRDQNGTHFVYTNRGQRHLGPDSNATVRVFTVPDKDLDKFSRDIYAAFTSENRDTVSKFIEANKSYSKAPSKLQKSNQKVGNCTIANSNIAWHFQLASDYLKKEENRSKTYEEALIATKEAYKELRIKDRIKAFKDLLALQPNANYPQDAYMNDVLQALGKLDRKSGAQNPNYIQLLLQDKEVSTKLTRILIKPDFKHHLDNFLAGIKGISHREGIRNKMEGMRDKILSTSFAKLELSEQEKLIKQDFSWQKYSAQSKKIATKEQLAQLLRKFNSETSPIWNPIIEYGIGHIGIDNTPGYKPGIVTRNHKIVLNDDGSFTVLNRPSFQKNTSKEECEKIIVDVLKRIPEDVIIPKLKSVPSPTLPTAKPFLATNPQQVAQLLREIKEKDSFSWKELANDQAGRIGVDYVPPYAPGIITKNHKIELRDDGFKVLNKYHSEHGVFYVENTENPEEIIESILKRIPNETISSLLNPTPVSSELDPAKVEKVTRLIKHYAKDEWKRYAGHIEFYIGKKSDLPSLVFNNYQLMIPKEPNEPIIFLNKANNNQPVDGALHGKILDAILNDVDINKLQTAVPSALDPAKVEEVTRLIEHYATGKWKDYAQHIEFGIGNQSQLHSLVFNNYQLMIPDEPNKPIIFLDKTQNNKPVDDVLHGKILDAILNDVKIKQLQTAVPSALDKAKVEQITRLINHYAIGDWEPFSDKMEMEFGIGKKSKLRTLVFDHYQLMVTNDPNKPLILLDKAQEYKTVDQAQQGSILDALLNNSEIKQLQTMMDSEKKDVSIKQPSISWVPAATYYKGKKGTRFELTDSDNKGKKVACCMFETVEAAQAFAAQWRLPIKDNSKTVYVGEERVNFVLRQGMPKQNEFPFAQQLQSTKDYSITKEVAYDNIIGILDSKNKRPLDGQPNIQIMEFTSKDEAAAVLTFLQQKLSYPGSYYAEGIKQSSVTESNGIYSFTLSTNQYNEIKNLARAEELKKELPKLSKDEFIETTNRLIKAKVFQGRSSGLEKSLILLCDALKNGSMIDGSNLSAQVTAGWYAEGQKNTASGLISADRAWDFLFKEMGNLGNDIYKKAIRDRLVKEFDAKEYPLEVRRLWFDTFSDQLGYKKDSTYAKLENFISGPPAYNATEPNVQEKPLISWIPDINKEGKKVVCCKFNTEEAAQAFAIQWHVKREANSTTIYLGEERINFALKNGTSEQKELAKELSLASAPPSVTTSTPKSSSVPKVVVTYDNIIDILDSKDKELEPNIPNIQRIKFTSKDEADAVLIFLQKELSGSNYAKGINQSRVTESSKGTFSFPLSANQYNEIKRLAEIAKELKKQQQPAPKVTLKDVLNSVEPQIGTFSQYQTTSGHGQDIPFESKPAQKFLHELGVPNEIALLSKKADGEPLPQGGNLDVTVNSFDPESQASLVITGARIDRLIKSAKTYVNTDIFPEGHFKEIVAPGTLIGQTKEVSPKTGIHLQNMAVGVCHVQEIDLLATPILKDGKAILGPRTGTIEVDDPAMLLLSTPALNIQEGAGYFLAKEQQVQYIESMYRTLFHATVSEGREYIALPAAGLGVFGGDPETYFKSLMNVAKEFPQLNIIYNSGRPENADIFDGVLKTHNPTNVVRTDRDVLIVAHELTKQGKPCAFHNPSDADVILGINDVGQYWKYGIGDGYVGEEHIGAMSTAPLNSRLLNPKAYENVVEHSFLQKPLYTLIDQQNLAKQNAAEVPKKQEEQQKQEKEQKSVNIKELPKLSKDEFIETTESLIKAGVFKGRAFGLENSLKVLCDALRDNSMIDGSKLSVQVTAGWYAEGQKNTASGIITTDMAWNSLFKGMGGLGNHIYKDQIRKNLEGQFNIKEYPPKVKSLWFDTFSNQEGYKEDSIYAKLENFISDLPEYNATEPNVEANKPDLGVGLDAEEREEFISKTESNVEKVNELKEPLFPSSADKKFESQQEEQQPESSPQITEEAEEQKKKAEDAKKASPLPPPEVDHVNMAVRDEKFILTFKSKEAREAFLTSMGGQQSIDPEQHHSLKEKYKTELAGKQFPELVGDLSLSFDSFSSTDLPTHHIGIVCATKDQTKALINALDSELGAYNPDDPSYSLYMADQRLLNGEIVTTRQFLPYPEANHVSMGVKDKGIDSQGVRQQRFYLKFNNEKELNNFLDSIGGQKAFADGHLASKLNHALKQQEFPQRVNALTLSFPCYPSFTGELAIACISSDVSRKLLNFLNLGDDAFVRPIENSALYMKLDSRLNKLLSEGQTYQRKYELPQITAANLLTEQEKKEDPKKATNNEIPLPAQQFQVNTQNTMPKTQPQAKPSISADNSSVTQQNVKRTAQYRQYIQNFKPNPLNEFKAYIGGDEYNQLGKRYGFSFMPKHIKVMCEATTFADIKKIAETALEADSPRRDNKVQCLYEAIRDSETLEEVKEKVEEKLFQKIHQGSPN